MRSDADHAGHQRLYHRLDNQQFEHCLSALAAIGHYIGPKRQQHGFHFHDPLMVKRPERHADLAIPVNAEHEYMEFMQHGIHGHLQKGAGQSHRRAEVLFRRYDPAAHGYEDEAAA